MRIVLPSHREGFLKTSADIFNLKLKQFNNPKNIVSPYGNLDKELIEMRIQIVCQPKNRTVAFHCNHLGHVKTLSNGY